MAAMVVATEVATEEATEEAMEVATKVVRDLTTTMAGATPTLSTPTVPNWLDHLPTRVTVVVATEVDTEVAMEVRKCSLRW